MKRTFRNLILGFTGGLLLVGCAGPPDPPAGETLNEAWARAHPVIFKDQDGKPKALTPEERQAKEDAKIERQIEALAHYGAALAHRERGEEKKALEEFYKAAVADPSNEKIVMVFLQPCINGNTHQRIKITPRLLEVGNAFKFSEHPPLKTA